jgi:hypothetical protein
MGFSLVIPPHVVLGEALLVRFWHVADILPGTGSRPLMTHSGQRGKLGFRWQGARPERPAMERRLSATSPTWLAQGQACPTPDKGGGQVLAKIHDILELEPPCL